MLSIEKKIAPLLQSQFPGFYQEEGQLFIAFMKAYYEWMENYTQVLFLQDATEFNVGDTVTQVDTTGTILSKTGNQVLVEVDGFNVFRCNINCDTLNPLISSSGAQTFIESNEDFSPLFWSRHLPEIRDIDNTLDRFILQFKNKYLPNIQFVTASSKELFIKNSLDFYRAKGTERAVDLFFKLIHGFEAKVYYPGDDLFRPSDNEWVDVRYLEIEPKDTNVNMVGQVVHGTLSDASGFAERLVRVKKEGRFINVLYLSNLEGNFQTGENVFTKDLDNNVTAKMFGSLTSLEILVSDDGFEVGEDLFIEDGRGKQGRARVGATTTFIGAIDFELTEGGWGYTEDAEVLGSDRVIQVSNVNNSNTQYYNLNTTFEQFETVQQNLLKLEIANADFEITVNAIAYTDTDDVVAEGPIVFSNSSSIIINFDSDTADANLFSNVATVNVNSSEEVVISSEDVTATGRIIGVSSNSTIVYTSNNGDTLNRGEILYQTATINNVERRVANGSVDRAFIDLEPTTNTYFNFVSDIGTFRTDRPFYRDRDDAEFNIVDFSNTSFGIVNPVNTFYNDGEIYGLNSGTSGIVAGNFAFEEEASFIVTEFNESYFIPNFKNEEFIDILDLENQIIGANAYANLTSATTISDNTKGFNDVISDFTEFSNVSIGSIETIVETGPGLGYPIDPFFVVNEPVVEHLERYDYQIEYADSNRNFEIGEIVEGNTTGARGRIFFHDINNRILRVTRVEIGDGLAKSKDFIRGEEFTSEDTNITSEITDVFELRREPRTGVNADVLSEAFSGPGFVTQLDIVDSGYGYEEGEFLVLRSFANPDKEVSAIARLGRQGIGQGYHINRKSFLSSDKYIQDSDFFQEYSYQVLTSLPFETYRDTLVKVLHVAGTKPFGAYVSTTETSIDIGPRSETEGFEVKKENVFINENVFYQHLLDCLLFGDLQTQNGDTDLEDSYCPADTEVCELDDLCQEDLNE